MENESHLGDPPPLPSSPGDDEPSEDNGENSVMGPWWPGAILVFFGLSFGIKDIYQFYRHISVWAWLIQLDLFLLLAGFLWLKYRPPLANLALTIISFLLCMGAMEVVLRSGLADDLDSPSPVWISPYYRNLDREIDRKHHKRALRHPHKFNDIIRPVKKPEGHFRIAVLGDSFVWGDGVEDQDRWTKILESKIEKKYQKIEVLHWGYRGMNTARQYRFLTQKGVHYDLDLLIIGFVINDIDLGRHTKLGRIKWFHKTRFVPLKYLFPYSMDFFKAYLDRFFKSHLAPEYTYEGWLKRMYRDNLDGYTTLLKRLSFYLEKKKVPLIVFFTPSNYAPLPQQYFSKVIPSFEEAGIEYVNLHPAVYRDLHHLPLRSLWANPADGHPGRKVNEVLAREVYQYLEKRDRLPEEHLQK